MSFADGVVVSVLFLIFVAAVLLAVLLNQAVLQLAFLPADCSFDLLTDVVVVVVFSFGRGKVAACLVSLSTVSLFMSLTLLLSSSSSFEFDEDDESLLDVASECIWLLRLGLADVDLLPEKSLRKSFLI